METTKRLVSLWDMFSFDVQAFINLVSGMIAENWTITLSQQNRCNYEISEEHFVLIKKETEKILLQSALMNLPMTARRAEKLLEILEQVGAVDAITNVIGQSRIRVIPVDKFIAPVLARRMGDLTDMVKDEMAGRSYLCLNEEEFTLYQPKTPHFGQDVRGQFPSAIYEMDEASKCLAIGRSTACVFHLMRALEIALKGLR